MEIFMVSETPLPSVWMSGFNTLVAIILFNDKERKIAEDVVHRMVKRAVEMEGTVTGEHGVGMIKRDYLDHELGQSTVNTMRKVCFVFRFPPPPLESTTELLINMLKPAQASSRPSMSFEL